jgi:hypothetical protein
VAWVEKRPSKRARSGFTYRVCDIDHGREIVLESGFERKKDALALARRIDGDKARGKRPNLEGRRTTLDAWFQEFMDNRIAR